MVKCEKCVFFLLLFSLSLNSKWKKEEEQIDISCIPLNTSDTQNAWKNNEWRIVRGNSIVGKSSLNILLIENMKVVEAFRVNNKTIKSSFQ